MSRIIVSENCIGCGICADDCTRRAISVINGKAVSNAELCNECFHCEAICPTGAVSAEGFDRGDIVPVSECDITPDDFLLFQKSRRSIRKYKKTEISNTILNKIIEAGRYSPTGGNLQTNHFIIVKDRLEELRTKVIDTLYELSLDDERMEILHLSKYKNSWRNMYSVFHEKGEDRLFFGAPCLVIIVNTDITGNGDVNGGIAASRMELLANTFGLGVCYIGFLKRALSVDQDIKKIIGLKEGEVFTLSFVMGYPDVKYLRTVNRKDVDVRFI